MKYCVQIYNSSRWADTKDEMSQVREKGELSGIGNTAWRRHITCSYWCTHIFLGINYQFKIVYLKTSLLQNLSSSIGQGIKQPIQWTSTQPNYSTVSLGLLLNLTFISHIQFFNLSCNDWDSSSGYNSVVKLSSCTNVINIHIVEIT